VIYFFILISYTKSFKKKSPPTYCWERFINLFAFDLT
jgi:hypothetical protein